MDSLPHVEEAPAEFARRHRSSVDPVDVTSDEAVNALCTRYGVDRKTLEAAISMVGPMPAALQFYFASHGSRQRVITDEIRALGPPKRQVEQRVRRKN